MNNFNALKWLSISFLTLLGILIPLLYIFASTPFETNFNSYNLGELVGQDSWAGNSGYSVIIDSNCLEGKCVFGNNENEIWKTGTNSDNGTWNFYLWLENKAGTYNLIFFYSNSLNMVSALNVYNTTDLKFRDTDNNYHLIKSGIEYEQWIDITCQWTLAVVRSMRCQYKDEPFTDWFEVENYPVGAFSIYLFKDFKLDYISELGYFPGPEILGVDPVSSTEITDLETNLTIDYYNFDWDIYDGFVVNFKDNKIE